jgi:16S rRNA (adenine1518-N6/adenine1519-N6)-dimethyltransferase
MSRSRRKRLGQNFLVDRRVAEAIVSQLDELPPRVLEIGPGRGALTEPLLERFERVLALELDEGLLGPLGQRFHSSSLELVRADALHDPLEPLVAGEAPWQLVSNLPYSVGTAIVRRLLPRHDLITRMVVMLQREVADRLVASPGDRGHALLALERAAHARARKLFDVPPESFRPRPRVHSTVVVLDLHASELDGSELQRALALAAHALTKPRKTLANALRPLGAPEHIEAAGLDPTLRPGTLGLDGWLELARAMD